MINNKTVVTKKERVAYLKQTLATNEKWALKAIGTIYRKQTYAEMASNSSTENNGVGFTGTDAEILTSIMKQYLQRGKLTPKQMKIIMKKAPKYHKQILADCDDKKLVTCMLKDKFITRTQLMGALL